MCCLVISCVVCSVHVYLLLLCFVFVIYTRVYCLFRQHYKYSNVLPRSCPVLTLCVRRLTCRDAAASVAVIVVIIIIVVIVFVVIAVAGATVGAGVWWLRGSCNCSSELVAAAW